MVVDVEGNELNINDEVWFARKHEYKVSGILIKTKITKIASSGNSVYMGSMVAADPSNELLKIN